MKIIRFVKSAPKLLCQQPAECGFTGTGNPENDRNHATALRNQMRFVELSLR
jgi:hypothetical protein